MSTPDQEKLLVYYDGACPGCRADRRRYERLAGTRGGNVEWLDITGRDEELQARGIEPRCALRELHVEDEHGHIHREMDAYRLLMRRIPLLRPLGWLIGLPVVRPALSRWYRHWVERRLRRDGRSHH